MISENKAERGGTIEAELLEEKQVKSIVPDSKNNNNNSTSKQRTVSFLPVVSTTLSETAAHLQPATEQQQQLEPNLDQEKIGGDPSCVSAVTETDIKDESFSYPLFVETSSTAPVDFSPQRKRKRLEPPLLPPAPLTPPPLFKVTMDGSSSSLDISTRPAHPLAAQTNNNTTTNSRRIPGTAMARPQSRRLLRNNSRKSISSTRSSRSNRSDGHLNPRNAQHVYAAHISRIRGLGNSQGNNGSQRRLQQQQQQQLPPNTPGMSSTAATASTVATASASSSLPSPGLGRGGYMRVALDPDSPSADDTGGAGAGGDLPLPLGPKRVGFQQCFSEFMAEVWSSGELLFATKIAWLLMCGPAALVGDFTGILSESWCFVLAAGALIPCAERLSFVTEQVAAHTNGTFGALLNATFGNAPELLISSAALRAGFYRVVQLTLLGSILTNLLLVFGCSCVVGGWRWKVQSIRLTSGNVSIGMLFIATSGLVLPAALKLSNQTMFTRDGEAAAELQFSRINATVMMSLYIGYLFFQLHTHKEEFDDDDMDDVDENDTVSEEDEDGMNPNGDFEVEMLELGFNHGVGGSGTQNGFSHMFVNYADDGSADGINEGVSAADNTGGNGGGVTFAPDGKNMTTQTSNQGALFRERETEGRFTFGEDANAGKTGATSRSKLPPVSQRLRRKRPAGDESASGGTDSAVKPAQVDNKSAESSLDAGDAEKEALVRPPVIKARGSDIGLDEDGNESLRSLDLDEEIHTGGNEEAQVSFRAGIVWLFAITLCISAMSDIIVQTIDGFAFQYRLSEVFTALVVVPIFSNIAEQTSAILFAYRNKMDLCVGITVGSAIQISLFVLPGCVLIGWAVDRSMSLFFQGFETCCLIMGVLSVAAVLQGGTSNWLTGFFCIGVYLMIATGFYFHQVEDLSTDEELALHVHNTTVAPGGR